MNKLIEPQFEIVQEQRDEEHSELGRLLGVILDERKIIIIISLVFLLGGIFNALFSTPVYKADALLQVEPKSSGMPGLGELTGAFELESEAITEIEVLKSRMVLGQVVDELKLDTVVKPNYFPLVGRGISRFLDREGKKSFGSIFSSYAWDGEHVQLSKLEVPDYLVGEELKLVAEANKGFKIFRDGELLLTGQAGSLKEESGLRVLVSDLTDRPGLRFHIKRTTKLAAIRNLQEELAVIEKGRNSGVLVVSLTGTDPEHTRRILDSVSKMYLLQNVKRMSAEAEKSLDFLEQQLPDIQKKLMASEGLLNSYRLKNESVDLTLETKSILESVVNLEEQLNELALEETKLKKLFTPEHPYYISLIEKRNTLTVEKEKLQEKIKGLPATQQEILRLTRDLEVNQAIYVEMLNKVQELAIVKAGTVGNVRILDTAALLEKPVKPRRGRIVIVSLILGLLLGIAVAFIRVSLRHGIKSADELEAIGLPVYATVPFSKVQQKISKDNPKGTRGKGQQKITPDKPTLLAAIDSEDIAIESLRSLRTSMHFAMLETKNNILMITGSGQDLGKSFVSANLGAVYAQARQKVLVIDCDLRKGHMNQVFALEHEPGLSELLSGQIEKSVAIKKTEVEGLDFVPCGTVPPNPAEILMHKNMKAFLEWASKEYDMVIVDTPPVLAVTDATIVGSYAGITMFVARFEDTQRKEVEMALRRCEQSGIAVKGCILNGIIHRSASSYGYGYSSYRYMQNKYGDTGSQ